MRKLLVLQHIQREPSSRIAEYADERGITLDLIKLWEPYTLPSLSSYDALIVLGGPMGVYEDFPSKADELALIREHVHEMPMLGICLGAQLIAHALGARVYPMMQEGARVKEVGHYEIAVHPHARSSKLFKDFPERFQALQLHGDTFDVPTGASLLASTELCENQAFSRGNAHGLQFHIEITPRLLREIMAEDAWAREGLRAEDEEKLYAEAEALETTMRAQCYQLLDNFLS